MKRLLHFWHWSLYFKQRFKVFTKKNLHVFQYFAFLFWNPPIPVDFYEWIIRLIGSAIETLCQKYVTLCCYFPVFILCIFLFYVYYIFCQKWYYVIIFCGFNSCTISHLSLPWLFVTFLYLFLLSLCQFPFSCSSTMRAQN